MSRSIDAVTQRLREAAEAVDAASIPEDLRSAAFTAAFDLLGEDMESGSGTPPQPQSPPASEDSEPTGGLLAKLARKLQLDESNLSYVYEESEGNLNLVLRRNMLPNPASRAAAMRDVSLLCLAGRQAAELDEWTAFDVLRAECEDLNVLDRANFATEVQTLDILVRGPRRTKEAKLTRHGFDRATELIRGILEGMGASAASVS